MTLKLDDALLVAYADGELDAQTEAELEYALAGDPAAARRVAALRESAGMIRAALHGPLHEPVPGRLVAAIDQALAQSPAASRDRSPPPVHGAGAGAKNDNWKAVRAIAAGLGFLAVGLGCGYFAADYRIQKSENYARLLREQDRMAREQTLAKALETLTSGKTMDWQNPGSGSIGRITPVRTFKDKSGRFCREYRDETVRDGVTETFLGIACRDKDAGWVPKLRLVPYRNSTPGT